MLYTFAGREIDLVWQENINNNWDGLEQAFWTIVSQYTKWTENQLR